MPGTTSNYTNTEQEAKSLLGCLAAVVALFLFIFSHIIHIDTVRDMTKDIKGLKQSVATLQKENSKLKGSKPSWYERAYAKCTSKPMSEDFTRQCVAFEIRELHR